MTSPDVKEELHGYLRGARETLVWKLDGLGEYDVRRPLTPTGTNLLGLVKHSSASHVRYFWSRGARHLVTAMSSDVEDAAPAPSLVEQPMGLHDEEERHMATTELQAIVRFRFHDGDVEEFKRLSGQCMEIVRTQDTGTLQYDTFFNDDETECIVIERFRDSEALIQHGENLAHLMDAIIATGSVSGELLGEPSAELRGRFASDGPVQLFTPWSRL